MTLQDLIEKLKRYPIPSACGAIVLVCLLLFYLRMTLITDLEIRHEDAARQSMQVDSNLVAGANLAQHLDEMRTMTASLDARLVRQLQLAENQKYFYQIESTTGVTLTDIRQNTASAPAKSAPQRAFTDVGYSVLLSGTFPQVVAYLNELENGAHFYRIKSLNLQRGREANQSSVAMALNLELLGLP